MKKILIVNISAFIAIGILLLVFHAITHALPEQYTADRYGYRDKNVQSGAQDQTAPYAHISVFYNSDSQLSIDAARSLDMSIKNALSAASINGNITDCYTMPEIPATAVTPTYLTANVSLIPVGGNFFLFHPYELLSGVYFSPDSVTTDGAIIDENAAWTLFGSSDVAGQLITMNGKDYIISGVIRIPDNAYYEASNKPAAIAFVQYQNYAQEGGFTSFEVLLPNPVTGSALDIVTTAVGVNPMSDSPSGIILNENSARYNFLTRLKSIPELTKTQIRTADVVFPFYENAALVSDSAATFVLIGIFAVLLIPICTIIYLLHKLHKNRKKVMKKILSKTASAIKEAKTNIENNNNEKAGNTN
ncbi:MAG: ABC transporter permease [Ruminococcus sp.]|nr:ABC transporter permease [Ruminococcus sp.]